MNVFRRIILPVAFLGVLILIAALLAWIAFKPAAQDAHEGLTPTGEPAGSVVSAERGSITNTLELKGTISVDSPTAVAAMHDGTVNHFFAEPGDEVLAGAALFQVKTDGSEAGDTGPAEDSDRSASDGAEAPAEAAQRPRYHTVVADSDGTVSDFMVKRNDSVSADTVVVNLLQKSFKAKAAIKAIDLYRVPELPKTASITISDGPAPFDCTKLRLDQGAGAAPAEAQPDDSGDPEVSSGIAAESGDEASDGPQLICAVPEDITVYNGLDLSMTIEAGSADDVVLVPVTAVRGLTGKGTIWVVDDNGEATERAIETGLNDGSMVEVTKGLKDGEQIQEFVPGTEPSVGDPEGDMSDDMSGMTYEEGDF